MIQILMLLVFLAVCGALPFGSAKTRAPMGWILEAAGLAVFLIRLQREGPYAVQ